MRLPHSWSGIGLVRDERRNRKDQIIERRKRILGNKEEPKWNFKQWKADYVIIEIGSNDFGNDYSNDFIQEFLECYDKLIDELFDNYGKEIKIILIRPVLTLDNKDIIENVLKRNKERNIILYDAFYSLNEKDKSLWGFCDHPNFKGHNEISNQIIPQIKHLFE